MHSDAWQTMNDEVRSIVEQAVYLPVSAVVDDPEPRFIRVGLHTPMPPQEPSSAADEFLARLKSPSEMAEELLNRKPVFV